MHINVNTETLDAKLCAFCVVGCYLNPIKVAVNGWG